MEISSSSESEWFRSLLKGIVNAFMLCEAIALYEVIMKFALLDLEFTSVEEAVQVNLVWMAFPIIFTIFIEFVAYFKVLKPISREALDKQTVTKSWVNVLFFLSFIFGGLMTAGGIVAMALLAILIAALETKAK